jgi:hypothetical protein
MGILKKVSMVGLAAVTVLALTMPSAEARHGRKGALIGGLIVGAVAGAVIAGAARADNNGYGYGDRGYGYPGYAQQPVYGGDPYYQPAPVYYQPAPVYYQPAPVYRPARRYYGYYGCGPGPQAEPGSSGREKDLYQHDRRKWKKACRNGGYGYGGY